MRSLSKHPLMRLLLPSLLLVGVIFWLFSLPVASQAPDLVTARAYFEDNASQQDIRSIPAQDFKPFSGPLFLGNHLRPLWLRLTLAPSPETDWVLQLQGNTLQHAEVYQSLPSGGWQRQETGTYHAFNARPVRSLIPSVQVQAEADHPVTVYVRIITPTTPVHAMVLRKADADHLDSLLELIAGFFLGMGVILSTLSALIWLVSRDPLWGMDALNNLVGLLMLSLHLGLAGKWLWPDSINLTNQVIVLGNCMYLALISVFMGRLMQLFALRGRMLWTYVLSPLMLPIQLWLALTGHPDRALEINNLTILAQILWTLVLFARARSDDAVMLRVFRVFLALLTAYNIMWSVSIALHLQTGNLGALYPNIPTSLFTMLMMLLILGRYTQLRLQEARQLALVKLESEQRLLFERQRHEETSSFLGMVLHEVKSPLNYIRMASTNIARELAAPDAMLNKRLQGIQSSVDKIDAVLERSIEVDALEHGGLQLRPVERDVVALVLSQLEDMPGASRLVCDLPISLVASVDAEVLCLMLRNLLDNSVKYAASDTDIVVRLWRERSDWRLQVRNQVGSVGFPDAERLFSKYYRSPLASRDSGMGLGLYWVSGAAARMGGQVNYACEGNDVVFTICLPL